VRGATLAADRCDVRSSTDSIAWSLRLAARSGGPRLLMSPTREEATMSATVDERKAKDRTMDRLAALVEDAAVIALLFSLVALVAAVVVAALVI
jgi:hypothetical protein